MSIILNSSQHIGIDPGDGYGSGYGDGNGSGVG